MKLIINPVENKYRYFEKILHTLRLYQFSKNTCVSHKIFLSPPQIIIPFTNQCALIVVHLCVCIYLCFCPCTTRFSTPWYFHKHAELPQLEQFHFNANGVNGGQAVRVMCMAISGDLPIDIHWLKDGQPLLRSIYHKIDEYTLILSLRQTIISDSGNYTCVARNAAGEARRWSVLKVKGEGVGRLIYPMRNLVFRAYLIFNFFKIII